MSVVSKSSQEQSHGAAGHSPASSFLILHGKMLILTSPPQSGTDDTFQIIPVRWEKLEGRGIPTSFQGMATSSGWACSRLDDQLSLASSFLDVLYVFRVTGQPKGFAHEAIKRVFIFFLPHLIHVRAE